MANARAFVLGCVGAVVLVACADSVSLAEREPLEEYVSLDEAVVEIDGAAEAEPIETGLEAYAPANAGAQADVVDLDLASDSG